MARINEVEIAEMTELDDADMITGYDICMYIVHCTGERDLRAHTHTYTRKMECRRNIA